APARAPGPSLPIRAAVGAFGRPVPQPSGTSAFGRPLLQPIGSALKEMLPMGHSQMEMPPPVAEAPAWQETQPRKRLRSESPAAPKEKPRRVAANSDKDIAVAKSRVTPRPSAAGQEPTPTDERAPRTRSAPRESREPTSRPQEAREPPGPSWLQGPQDILGLAGETEKRGDQGDLDTWISSFLDSSNRYSFIPEFLVRMPEREEMSKVLLGHPESRLVASDSDESCAAGGSESCRAGAASTATTRRAVAPAAPGPQVPQLDLITQEVEELKALMRISAGKRELLQVMQEAARSPRTGRPAPLSEAQARALREQVPELSELAAEGERTPLASAADYLVSKALVALETAASRLVFLQLHQRGQPTTSTPSSTGNSAQIPQVVLVAALLDGTVKLISPSGAVLFSFASGHEGQVTQLAVSSAGEEHLVATGDASGHIRVQTLLFRQVRGEAEEEKAAERPRRGEEKRSRFLDAQLNVTAKLQQQMQLPPGTGGEVPLLTSLAIGIHRSSKQTVAGDAEGRISIFGPSGNLKGSIDATAMEGPGIEDIAVHGNRLTNQMIFRAGIEWGFVNLDKMEVQHMDCPKFEGRVASAVLDSNVSSRVLLSDDAGSVWVFNIKNRKNCQFERKFPPSTSWPAPLQLTSIDGFAIALQKA
ncbi:unnamed protein product, partial [Polarella glacialis]